MKVLAFVLSLLGVALICAGLPLTAVAPFCASMIVGGGVLLVSGAVVGVRSENV